MGTRGAIGFIVDDKEKVTYNHFDSYPSELGVQILEYIAATQVEKMLEAARRIELVNEDSTPTPAQIKALKKFADTGVGNQSLSDWYCLLRSAQGNLGAYAKAGVMIDSHRFLHDSLFCEWAYLINLDSGKLEVYRGFNKNPKAAGRYAGIRKPDMKGRDGTIIPTEYNGVVLIAEHPLEELRKGFANRFGKIPGELLILEISKGWQRIADDQQELEERAGKESHIDT